MEVQAGDDGAIRGWARRCGVTGGLQGGSEADADGEGRTRWFPASQWVAGWLVVGQSAEEQASEGRGGEPGDLSHFFLEGGSVSPNTWPSDGKEQVVFTSSWALNKGFQ